MTGSSEGRVTLSASMSGEAPSLTHSMHSFSSKSKLSLNNSQSLAAEKPAPKKEDFVTELLEKAKFYTSLCLGKLTTNVKSILCSYYVQD